MPVFQNILRKGKNPYQGLKDFDVFVDVRNDNNQYFNVSDFPEELTLGNSSFLIEGSDLLKNNIELKLEILDSAENVIFTTPVDEYLEGKARRVSIEAYLETEPGPASCRDIPHGCRPCLFPLNREDHEPTIQNDWSRHQNSFEPRPARTPERYPGKRRQ